MKRVASLYLPLWAIERVLRDERPAVPSPQPDAMPDLLALKAAAGAEQGGKACDAPRNTGWRPGARWARADVDRRIAELPLHQRPPMRDLGRRSEAAEMPFKRLPGDDGGKSSGWVEPSPERAALVRWNEMPSVRSHGEGARPDKHARHGSNDPASRPPGVAPFFDTARSTAGTLARVCREDARASTPSASISERALVTVQKTGSRIEIAAVSPAAAALGVAPGMALTQARASVPGLDVRDADPDGDRADLERLALTLARRWCPVVAIADAESLFLDVTGVAHLHGGEAAMARRIVRLLARLGVTARVAIADTTGAAWAMARYLDPPRAVGRGTAAEGGGGGTVGPGEPPSTARPPSALGATISPSGGGFLCLPSHHGLTPLAPLPVTALRLEPAAVELARRLGIDTVGELAALPRAPLVRRFGRTVAQRLDQATGAASEPLDLVVPPEPIVVVRRFAEPIATAEAIRHWLEGLVAELAEALAEAGLGARAVVLACLRVDGDVQPIRVGLARPTRDPAHLLRLLARRIEDIDPGYGIDALELHVRRADPLGAETLGATLAGEDAPDLAPLVDTLANRIGAARLWRIRPLESDVPERSVARVAPLDPAQRGAPALRPGDVRLLDTRAPADPWHPRWPRPVRLLHHPERIDHVLAELPDFPPLRFTWRGTTHRVVRGDGPERVFGEWWRRTAERELCRDYFRVEDDTGHRFWLFRHGDGRRAETGDLTWYMHGAMG